MVSSHFSFLFIKVLNKTATLQSEALDDNETKSTTTSTSINNSNSGVAATKYNLETKIDNYPSDIMYQSSPTPNQQLNVVTTAVAHIPDNVQSIPQYQYQYHQQHSQQVLNHHHASHQQGALLHHQQMSPETSMYQMTEYSNATNGGWPQPHPASLHHATRHHILHPHAYHANQLMAHGQFVTVANATATTANAFQQPPVGYEQQRLPSGALHSNIVYSATQQSAPPLELSTPATCKSKSVPDIMRELKTEMQNAEGKRARNNSQSEREVAAASAAGPAVDGNANQRGK